MTRMTCIASILHWTALLSDCLCHQTVDKWTFCIQHYNLLKLIIIIKGIGIVYWLNTTVVRPMKAIHQKPRFPKEIRLSIQGVVV